MVVATTTRSPALATSSLACHGCGWRPASQSASLAKPLVIFHLVLDVACPSGQGSTTKQAELIRSTSHRSLSGRSVEVITWSVQLITFIARSDLNCLARAALSAASMESSRIARYPASSPASSALRCLSRAARTRSAVISDSLGGCTRRSPGIPLITEAAKARPIRHVTVISEATTATIRPVRRGLPGGCGIVPGAIIPGGIMPGAEAGHCGASVP